MKGVYYLNIEVILLIMVLSTFLARCIFINIKRLRSHNVFLESRFFIMFLGILILYGIISSIYSIVIKENHNISSYFQVLIYTIPIWTYLRNDIKQTTVSIENIYKSDLESILYSVFKKNNLVLVKKDTNNEKTVFLFANPYIKSRLIINTSFFSTKRHTLTIENKSDIPDIKEILDDVDSKISPISKKSIVIKFTIKISIVVYITWKFLSLFQ